MLLNFLQFESVRGRSRDGLRIALNPAKLEIAMVAAILIVTALVFLGIEVKFGTYGASGLAGAVFLSFGSIAFMRQFGYFHPELAVAVSIALGIIAVFQGYLGLRTRKNARLSGTEELIGQVAVARTEINMTGTVFVRGEYWQARSGQAIPAGARVSIERVQDLILYVKEA